jgi:hypothetical protein
MVQATAATLSALQEKNLQVSLEHVAGINTWLESIQGWNRYKAGIDTRQESIKYLHNVF